MYYADVPIPVFAKDFFDFNSDEDEDDVIDDSQISKTGLRIGRFTRKNVNNLDINPINMLELKSVIKN